MPCMTKAARAIPYDLGSTPREGHDPLPNRVTVQQVCDLLQELGREVLAHLLEDVRAAQLVTSVRSGA